MWIQLVRKLADQLDGIDVAAYREGEVFDVPAYEAELLIAEEWAISSEPRPSPVGAAGKPLPPAVATDCLKRRTTEQLRRVREAFAARRFDEQSQRRAEDQIREELHDARAKTITSRSTDNG